MRALNEAEQTAYNRFRDRNMHMGLPSLNGGSEVHVGYTTNDKKGTITHAVISIDGHQRIGFSVFSQADRVKGVKPNPNIGQALAFNRALKSPVTFE